jgi:hypothetical protein
VPLAEKIGNPGPGAPIIFLQREIDRLLAALLVDQPKSALSPIPDLVVVRRLRIFGQRDKLKANRSKGA